jgi:MFS superfamily sulfate permease-like transporter
MFWVIFFAIGSFFLVFAPRIMRLFVTYEIVKFPLVSTIENQIAVSAWFMRILAGVIMAFGVAQVTGVL